MDAWDKADPRPATSAAQQRRPRAAATDAAHSSAVTSANGNLGGDYDPKEIRWEKDGTACYLLGKGRLVGRWKNASFFDAATLESAEFSALRDSEPYVPFQA